MTIEATTAETVTENATRLRDGDIDTVSAELGTAVDAYTRGGDDTLPLFIEPRSERLRSDLDFAVGWFAEHRPLFDRLLAHYGACFLRGFPIADTAAFNRLVAHYGSTDFGYAAGATPRERIAGRVFEATHAPADYKLKLHQEMAYLPQYPKQLAFYCLRAPESGGETIIGDMRALDARVDPAFRAAVKARGVLYTRNFRAPGSTLGNAALDSFHRPWPEAFSTEDKQSVAAQCEAMGLGHEWLGDGSVSVTYRAPGFVRHPLSGQEIWFNQIATQSITPGNMGADFCGLYHRHYGADRPWSYRTSYGDGTPIDEADVDGLYPLLDEITVAIPWRHGDVMLVDNFFTAHGRNPYSGERAVQVALLN